MRSLQLINNSIQVNIPQRKSSQSVVTKMKCQVTSSTTHDVLISKDISYKSYKDICSEEKTNVNLGYNNDCFTIDTGKYCPFKVENNSLIQSERFPFNYIHGEFSDMPLDWEIFSKFFTLYNIEPNWLDCNQTWGWYDEELGGWTGCMGKV